MSNLFMVDFYGGSFKEKESESKRTQPKVTSRDFPNPEFQQHCQNENQKLEKEYQSFLDKMRLSTRKNIEDFIEDDYGRKNRYFLKRNNRTISQMKEALNQKLGTCLPIDNIFDLATFKVIIQFQKEKNLKVDGLIGNNTQKILFDTKKETTQPRKWETQQTQERTGGQGIENETFYTKNAQILAMELDKIMHAGYKAGASCGANVGLALDRLSKIFGQALYDRSAVSSGRRDGKNWDEMLDATGLYEKVPISHPREAKPGGILVYDDGAGPTQVRRNYGHVEIVTNQQTYFYGDKQMNPGGSTSRVLLNTNDPNEIKRKTGFIGYVYYLRDDLGNMS